ncbi:MAG: hypothetical protein R2875_16720 [Desulfobacterales bacterium]
MKRRKQDTQSECAWGNLFEVDIPVNSMPLVVCYVRRSLDPSWSAVLSLDSFVFEVDHVSDILGHATTDKTKRHWVTKMSLLTASLEYVLCQQIKSLPLQPYIQAGLGIGFADFEIDDADSPAGGVGPGHRYRHGWQGGGCSDDKPWTALCVYVAMVFDAGGRFDYHVSHWTIKDRTSGRKNRIDHFQPWVCMPDSV